MCRGLFIELNADIKKPTAIGWFSWDFWSAREYSKRAYNHLI